MPSRQSHTKTPHGCENCKARRKRCDLGRPACQNCTRRNDACSYPNQAPSATTEASKTLDIATTSSQKTPLSVEDLELMHHYATGTFLHLTDVPEHLLLWQIDIPRLAFSHPFLLHGLLSLAALHRSQHAESQRASLVELARAHQHEALPMYIEQLKAITETNCHALFAYSIVLGGLTFGFLQVDLVDSSISHEGSAAKGIIAEMLAVFDTLIGATVVAVNARTWLRSGVLKPLLRPLTPASIYMSRLGAEMKSALEEILSYISGASRAAVAEEDKQTYANAVRGLGVAFPDADGHLPSVSEVVSWPVIAGAPYLQLLKNQDALALVVLAHYGAALHLSGQIWFLQGLGRRIVDAVSDCLEDEWLTIMQWVKKRVEE